MSTVLAVDPGIRGCGAAVFQDGTLVEAYYVRSPCETGNRACEAAAAACAVKAAVSRRWEVSTLIVEWPRVYRFGQEGKKRGADPNDLLALCGIGTSLAALFSPAVVHSYSPAEWGATGKPKRARDPYPVELKCRARLTFEGEISAAEAGTKAARALGHNVWDAIAIGLHHTGRSLTELKRVFIGVSDAVANV